jgi:hypothetical protein
VSSVAGKLYRSGYDELTGAHFVQVRRGERRWFLRHGCAQGDRQCLSPAGWTFGFGGAAANALARWMLIEALGLTRLDDSVAYESFAAQMTSRWLEPDWEISQAEVHGWVATFLASDPVCTACGEADGRANCVCAWRANWR